MQALTQSEKDLCRKAAQRVDETMFHLFEDLGVMPVLATFLSAKDMIQFWGMNGGYTSQHAVRFKALMESGEDVDPREALQETAQGMPDFADTEWWKETQETLQDAETLYVERNPDGGGLPEPFWDFIRHHTIPIADRHEGNETLN